MTQQEIEALRQEIEEATRPRVFRDDRGNLVAVTRGIGAGETWIAARGRHRVKSRDLLPQDDRGRMQVLLNAYAHRKGWKEFEMKTSPAPWINRTPGDPTPDSGCQIYSGQNHIATAHYGLPGLDHVDAQANARLIAAAPDLLVVARGALGYLESLPPSSRPDEAWFFPLREAIARAESR